MSSGTRAPSTMGAALICLLAASAAPAVAQEVHHFEIASSAAAAAIQEFGLQSGVQILAAGERLQGKRLNAVAGDLSTEQALLSLLAGSGMTHRYIGERAVALVAEEEAAREIVAQSTTPAVEAAQVSKPSFWRRLRLAQVATPEPVIGREAPPVTNTHDPATKLEEVVVTGSSIKGSQDYRTSSRPIDVVTAQDFEKTSGENIADFLLKLPVSTGNNINSATDEYGGGSTTINLRGIGDGYSLVLVDGRRFGGESYAADIGAVPAEAVESVEVLKGGASAVYGSDAVAGVVNIRLKKNFQGLELTSSYGDTTRHDAEFYRAAALFGVVDERFSFTGSVAYQNRDGFNRDARTLTASRDYRRFGGLDRRSGAIGTPHLIMLESDPGNPLSIDVSRFSPGYYSGNPADYVAYNHEAQAFSTNEIGTYPEQSQLSGHWSAEYRLLDDDKLTFFSRGYASHREQAFIATYMRPLLDVPADNPYNPFGEAVTVRYLLGNDEIGPWQGKYDTMNFQGTAGLSGVIAGINWETGFSSHRRRIKEIERNDIDSEAIQAAVERTDALAFNPFGYNANSPEQMALVRLPESGARRIDRNTVFDAKVDGKMFDWYAGEALFALGYEHRRVSYAFDPSFTARTRVSFFSYEMAEPESRSREVDDYFGEVRVPVYNAPDDSAMLHSAELSSAIRREKYSDFGSSTVWQSSGKVGFWGDSVVLRASYAESFKAPSVSALIDPMQTFENPNAYFDPVRGAVFPVTVISGGNPNLKPEMGESINIGLVVQPTDMPEASFSLDYWSLKLSGIIAEPDPQAILFGTSTAGSLVRDPVTQDVTLDIRLDNGGSRNVSGIDVGTAYRLETQGLGDFVFSLNATYLLEFEDVGNDGSRSNRRGIFSFDPGPMPNTRAVFGTSWQRGGFDAAGSVRYMSSYKDIVPGVLSREVGSYSTVDLQAGYNFAADSALRGTRIYGGLENAFDATLPFVASSFDGWDRSLADYRGRYFYFGAKYAF